MSPQFITLRVQSPEGTKRVDMSTSSSTHELMECVCEAFAIGNTLSIRIFKDPNGKDEIYSSKTRTLNELGLRHGDMLYMHLTAELPLTQDVLVAVSSKSDSALAFKEDDVDVQLAKLDGKINRQRDEKLCQHNSTSRCFNCSPLEPFNETYLSELKIKHLSFHSFLRKMTAGCDRGKFVALEDLTCRIRPGCRDHPPWPKGICSKCQPNAITLNQQTYRHVDNVQFENARIVEQFLDYWRVSGHQRLGILYGRYEMHPDVPLGIRTVVSAIYEPVQANCRDSIRLLPIDDQDEVVQHLAEMLGLKAVGWIFTDLTADDVMTNKVKHTRHAKSYFLSAQECYMAADYQNQHQNACKFATNGYFGSKFATVCVTGDATNQVHMEGYQVSNQCMALVRDNCFVPTKDAPELGYIRESSEKQYVPDVYFMEKDSYGNEVSRLARPLPVEYLLVDVPTSTPLVPIFTFNPDASKEAFPIENRSAVGHCQDFKALSIYLAQFQPHEFLNAISDFHLLIYIATMDMMPMRECMDDLLVAIRNNDVKAAKEWSQAEQWATVEQLIVASSQPQVGPSSSLAENINNSTAPTVEWTCPFCTFLNSSAMLSCEMCTLPRNGQ